MATGSDPHEGMLVAASRLRGVVDEGDVRVVSYEQNVAGLSDRTDVLFDALAWDDRIFDRREPHSIDLGRLGGIETNLHRLVRARPVAVVEYLVATRETVAVLTLEEAVRVAGLLLIARNAAVDFARFACLATQHGEDYVGSVLGSIDDYWADPARPGHAPIQSQIFRQLADPQPVDAALGDWENVADVCRRIAVFIRGARWWLVPPIPQHQRDTRCPSE